VSTNAIDQFSHFYVNGDSGYPWLRCDRCDRSVHCIEAGDTLPDLLLAASMHRCAAEREVSE